jgi:two-component system sensor histidine kinase PilS (NtrC family)
MSTDLAPGLWVDMDPSNLKQVLWNLLSNAAEAIVDGGTIRIRVYPERHRQAVIEIADDGCGMTPEVSRSMFDPFFTTKPNGTGLGLSIVHRILEPYGSRVSVESEPGRGTVARLRLLGIDAPTTPPRKES